MVQGASFIKLRKLALLGIHPLTNMKAFSERAETMNLQLHPSGGEYISKDTSSLHNVLGLMILPSNDCAG